MMPIFKHLSCTCEDKNILICNDSINIKIRKLVLIHYYHLIYRLNANFASCPNNVLCKITKTCSFLSRIQCKVMIYLVIQLPCLSSLLWSEQYLSLFHPWHFWSIKDSYLVGFPSVWFVLIQGRLLSCLFLVLADEH